PRGGHTGGEAMDFVGYDLADAELLANLAVIGAAIAAHRHQAAADQRGVGPTSRRAVRPGGAPVARHDHTDPAYARRAVHSKETFEKHRPRTVGRWMSFCSGGRRRKGAVSAWSRRAWP